MSAAWPTGEKTMARIFVAKAAPLAFTALPPVALCLLPRTGSGLFSTLFSHLATREKYWTSQVALMRLLILY